MNDTDPCPDGNNFSENDILNEKEVSDSKWDGSEPQLVFDDEAENYEDNMAGIKISYKLETGDVFEFFLKKGKRSEKTSKKALALKFLGLLALVIPFVFVIYSARVFLGADFRWVFAWLALLLLGLLLPVYLGLKNAFETFCDGSEYTVEIFPGRVEALHKGVSREYPLNESGKYKVTKKLIIIYFSKDEFLIIPIRAIKPDVLPDVQAMIAAGAGLL